MDNTISTLYYPMLTMFLWTFAVMLRNLQVRVSAVLQGNLTNAYFELFLDGQPSDLLIKTGNHVKNLFEFPVLFYIVVLFATSMATAPEFFVVLAWSYVALRIAHSIVHLTFNKVPARFTFYILSNIVLLAMWILVGINQ